VDFVSALDFRFFDLDCDLVFAFDFRFAERDRDFCDLRFGEDESDVASDFAFRFGDLEDDLASDFNFRFAERDRECEGFFFLRSFLSASLPLRGVGERLGFGVLLRELFEEDFLRLRLLLRDFRDLLRECDLFRLLTERRLERERLRDEPLRPRECDRRLVRCLAGTKPPFTNSSLFRHASS
jgi:hypothetical protein